MTDRSQNPADWLYLRQLFRKKQAGGLSKEGGKEYPDATAYHVAMVLNHFCNFMNISNDPDAALHSTAQHIRDYELLGK